MAVKRLAFMGSSLHDLRNFPDETRRAAGFELCAVRSGFEPGDWKRTPHAGWRYCMTETIVETSGNLFIDLGYSPEEAAILQMRADLMAGLRKFIKAKKLTQARAAEILGVSQSRVSDLNRGKWEKFSLEMLIILATKAGMRVTLKAAA
jgi:predicted XRE-type DNA-binding protein